MKKAEIIAVGTELLTPQRTDTNSLLITEQLNSLGVDVVRKQVVGDDRGLLASAIREALSRNSILILTGGLGPTEDDVTREAVSDALGRRLELSLDQQSILIGRFRQFNRPMAKNNLQQAYVLDGADVMPNPHGTAPGQFLSTDRGIVALLPGPPRELRAMVVDQLLPRLRPSVSGQEIRIQTFRITGIGESDLDTLISPVYKPYTNPVTTLLSAPGDLFVILRATGSTVNEAAHLLRDVGDPIRELLGDRIYTEDAAETLDAVVGRLLRKAQATVAVAESCTGGLLASRLTDQAGASDYFNAGYITYSEAQKTALLNVDAQLIRQHSAVSNPVAAAMAKGALARAGSTYGVSTTGWAGPGGGTESDPVGTVYIGIAGPDGTSVMRYRLGPDRYRVRNLGTQYALDLLRRRLMKLPPLELRG